METVFKKTAELLAAKSFTVVVKPGRLVVSNDKYAILLFPKCDMIMIGVHSKKTFEVLSSTMLHNMGSEWDPQSLCEIILEKFDMSF